MPEPERDIVTWEALDDLVARLAARLAAAPAPAGVLAISRGGRVPAGGSVVVYDDEGRPGDARFLEFPHDEQLRGKRVVVIDEVWDSGTTIAAVVERIRAAGGEPVTAVLHYKPKRSRVPLTPDHAVVETDAWVVYPFKAGR